MSEKTGEERSRYVRRMFGRIVPRYDLMNSLMTFGLDRRWRRLTANAAAVPDDGIALDIAAGTGELTLELARAGARLVVGADFCEEMLRAAGAKAAARGERRVAFVGADALALPFPDDTFDAVTVGFGLRNFGDLGRALAEMRRVARPGGRVVCLELTHPPLSLLSCAYWPYFHLVVPFLGRRVSGDREAYTYLPESVTRFPGARELARLMYESWLRGVRYRYAGFGTVAVHVGLKPLG